MTLAILTEISPSRKGKESLVFSPSDSAEIVPRANREAQAVGSADIAPIR